jgi:peptidoglycan hydrolase-like protein with peptidoglycan-binding domain
MGFYGDTPSGDFDAETIAGVRALQASFQIGVDGTVGRVTKLRLYERLGLYTVPRLQGGGEVAG